MYQQFTKNITGKKMSQEKDIDLAIKSGDLQRVKNTITSSLTLEEITNANINFRKPVPSLLNPNRDLRDTFESAVLFGTPEIMEYLCSEAGYHAQYILETEHFSAVEIFVQAGKTEMLKVCEKLYPQLGINLQQKLLKAFDIGAFGVASHGSHYETMEYLEALYKKLNLDVKPELYNAISMCFSSLSPEKRQQRSQCLEKFCKDHGYDIKTGLLWDNHFAFSHALSENDFDRLKEVVAFYEKYNLLDDTIKARFSEFTEAFCARCESGNSIEVQYLLDLCKIYNKALTAKLIAEGFHPALKNVQTEICNLLLSHLSTDKSIPPELLSSLLLSLDIVGYDKTKVFGKIPDEEIISNLPLRAEKIIQMGEGKKNYAEDIKNTKAFVILIHGRPDLDQSRAEKKGNFITIINHAVNCGTPLEKVSPIIERIFGKQLAEAFSSLHYAVKEEFLRTGTAEIDSPEKVIKTIDHSNKLEELGLEQKRIPQLKGKTWVNIVKKGEESVFFSPKEKEFAETAAIELHKADDRKNYVVVPKVFHFHQPQDFDPNAFKYVAPNLQTSVLHYSVVLENEQKDKQLGK
jgi:hypothetical protein